MYGVVDWLARLFAHLGGGVLAFLILLTCASVLGREINGWMHFDFLDGSALSNAVLGLGIGPVNGDFEIVEAGMAFAIFAFLPICQLHAAHASVDVFTSALNPRINRVLRAITEVVFAAVVVLIAVQLCAGMVSKFRSGQTTLLLQFPVWWSYAASTIAAFVAAAVAIYVAVRRWVEVITGAPALPAEGEAAH